MQASQRAVRPRAPHWRQVSPRFARIGHVIFRDVALRGVGVQLAKDRARFSHVPNLGANDADLFQDLRGRKVAARRRASVVHAADQLFHPIHAAERFVVLADGAILVWRQMPDIAAIDPRQRLSPHLLHVDFVLVIHRSYFDRPESPIVRVIHQEPHIVDAAEKRRAARILNRRTRIRRPNFVRTATQERFQRFDVGAVERRADFAKLDKPLTHDLQNRILIVRFQRHPVGLELPRTKRVEKPCLADAAIRINQHQDMFEFFGAAGQDRNGAENPFAKKRPRNLTFRRVGNSEAVEQLTKPVFSVPRLRLDPLRGRVVSVALRECVDIPGNLCMRIAVDPAQVFKQCQIAIP